MGFVCCLWFILCAFDAGLLSLFVWVVFVGYEFGWIRVITRRMCCYETCLSMLDERCLGVSVADLGLGRLLDVILKCLV